MASPAQSLLNLLAGMADDARDDHDLSEALRRALLTLGSETPDNMAAALAISITTIGGKRRLTLGDARLPLANLAHSLEDLPLPRAFSRDHPTLSPSDWDTFTRFLTLLLTTLEHEGPAS